MATTFGTVLKDWRNQRRMSQLDLGLSANVSARHISFLETGRSQPSRAMVLNLCEQMEVPRDIRNQFLSYAGMSPAYAKRALTESEMVPALSAVDWILERHAPYPAIAMDRYWVVVKMNRPAAALLAGMGLNQGDSLITALAQNAQVREAIDNFDEVLEHSITRLRTENTHLGGDPVLEAAIAQLCAQTKKPMQPSKGILPAFIPTRYRAGGLMFSFFSTFTQFGSAQDIALSELKIEMMFPADDATCHLLMAMDGGNGGDV